MSRDLAFWRYKDGVYLDDHQKIYEEVCCGGRECDSLQPLPINDIRQRLEREFSDYDKLDENNFESSTGAFTVTATDKSVLFNCSWSMEPNELNRIINVMDEFGVPYYDPQISIRFDEVYQKKTAGN